MRIKATLKGEISSHMADVIGNLFLKEKKDAHIRIRWGQKQVTVGAQEYGNQSEYAATICFNVSRTFEKIKVESARNNVIDIYCATKLFCHALSSMCSSQYVELRLSKQDDGHPCLMLKGEISGIQEKTMITLDTSVPIKVEEDASTMSPPKLQEPAVQLEVPIKRFSLWLDRMYAVGIKTITLRTRLNSDHTKSKLFVEGQKDGAALSYCRNFDPLLVVNVAKTGLTPQEYQIENLPLPRLRQVVLSHKEACNNGPVLVSFYDYRALCIYTTTKSDIGYVATYTFNDVTEQKDERHKRLKLDQNINAMNAFQNEG